MLARLAGKDPGSEEVDIELNNIKEALEVQSQGGFQLKELLTNGPSQNLRRTLLGIMAQFFQQICGINLIVRLASDCKRAVTDFCDCRPTTQLMSSRIRSASDLIEVDCSVPATARNISLPL